MPMTAVEKVLASCSGRSELRAGDVVEPQPDFVMIHEFKGKRQSEICNEKHRVL